MCSYWKRKPAPNGSGAIRLDRAAGHVGGLGQHVSGSARDRNDDLLAAGPGARRIFGHQRDGLPAGAPLELRRMGDGGCRGMGI